MDIAWFILVLVFLAVAGYYSVQVINRVIKLLETLNEKIVSIEEEITPILKEVDNTLKTIEPVTEMLAQKTDEIGSMIDNLEKTSSYAKTTTGAVRDGVVPLAHMLQGVVAALSEGSSSLKRYISSEND